MEKISRESVKHCVSSGLVHCHEDGNDLDGMAGLFCNVAWRALPLLVTIFQELQEQLLETRGIFPERRVL